VCPLIYPVIKEASMKKLSLLLLSLLSSSIFALGTITSDTDLNREQQEKLRILKAGLYGKISNTNSEIRNAKLEMRAIMDKRVVDESKVSALIDKISDLEKAKIVAKYTFARDVKTFLNDKQIKANKVDAIPEEVPAL
jgi:Spy/CpxP family protein refolding chaperone